MSYTFLSSLTSMLSSTTDRLCAIGDLIRVVKDHPWDGMAWTTNLAGDMQTVPQPIGTLLVCLDIIDRTSQLHCLVIGGDAGIGRIVVWHMGWLKGGSWAPLAVVGRIGDAIDD